LSFIVPEMFQGISWRSISFQKISILKIFFIESD